MYSYATVYLFVWMTISFVASSHVALFKRDSRSLVGWVGIIWLAPIAGAVFYWMFGINRIQRRAQKRMRVAETQGWRAHDLPPDPMETSRVGPQSAHLAPLESLVGRVVGRPLLNGNDVKLLQNGDDAFPEMLRAIESAQHSVTLSTYIFDRDEVGKQFINALQEAVQRGVLVRLLVDDVGIRYSFPTIVGTAKRANIPVARFLPVLIPWLFHYSNLRNHRKILVVDGRVGFTGGINIREGHCLQRKPRHAERDIHFRIVGPVVAHLQQSFAQDWFSTTGEEIAGEAWFPKITSAGNSLARGIADGPDADLDKLRMVLLGAIASAQSSITIVTPFFLPDAALIASLNVASLRGVDVRIVIPEKPDVRLVRWASMAQMWQVLEHGCRVWRSKAPFDHSKLMIVDGQWTLLGSMNWDPRSLRLNFEFNVECYDAELATSLQKIVDASILESRECKLTDVDDRNLLVRLRDGFARVLTPYL